MPPLGQWKVSLSHGESGASVWKGPCFDKMSGWKRLETKYHLLPGKLTCPLKINGWFRCISYWNSPFSGATWNFGGVGGSPKNMDLRKESIRFFGWWPWTILGGGFKLFLIFTPNPGEMIQFDVRIIFQMGWFNHQLVLKPHFLFFVLGWVLIFRLETLSKLHLRQFSQDFPRKGWMCKKNLRFF